MTAWFHYIVGGERDVICWVACCTSQLGILGPKPLPCFEMRLDYVLDAHGYQPLLNLNVMPYLSLAQSLNSYFAERLHRIVVLDMPMVMSLLVKAIVPLLPSKTRQKLFFARRGDKESLKPLYELCRDQESLEEA